MIAHLSIVLAFGWLMISSAFVLCCWALSARAHLQPFSRFNAPLMMAFGLDLHSLGMVLQIGGRLQQIWVDGQHFHTSDPIYWIGMVLFLAGKTLFVWVAALREGRSYSARIIWSYWAAQLAWAASVVGVVFWGW